jgi:EmrB/QacA subfamily drug resistance transporter
MTTYHQTMIHRSRSCADSLVLPLRQEPPDPLSSVAYDGGRPQNELPGRRGCGGLPVSSGRGNPKIVVGVVYVSALFMTILDATVVNVTLPKMAAEFGAAAIDGHAVIIGYLLSLAVFVPASGWFGDRFGTKRVFLIALGLFVGASVLCGFAQSMAQLIGFRVLQGAGGGLLTPVGLAMMLRAFEPSERARAARVLSIPTIFAPATGPVLGGLLADQLSWRWVFFVNVPLGLLGFVFGALFLAERVESDTGGFDLPGFVLSGVGLGAAMYALSEGPSRGWGALDIVICGVLGVLGLVALVVVERRTPEPMLRLPLFGDRLFRSNSVVLFLATAGFLGTLYLMPLFLQNARGASALSSGLTTFPEAIGVLCSVQVVGRIYPRIGPRRLQLVGLTGMSVMVGMMCLVGLDTNQFFIIALMFTAGVFMGFVFLPTQTAAFATVPSEALGRASALFNAVRHLGSAVGVALLSTVVAAIASVGDGSDLVAYHAGFFTAATMAMLAAAAALTVRDSDAASTLRQPKHADHEPLAELG